jgi:hypothetical protein
VAGGTIAAEVDASLHVVAVVRVQVAAQVAVEAEVAASDFFGFGLASYCPSVYDRTNEIMCWPLLSAEAIDRY